MRIIISPAKQMRVDTDTFTSTEVPVFMEKTEILKNIRRILVFLNMSLPGKPGADPSA